MAITPEENVALLEGIAARVARSAPEMAMAMGRVHERRMVSVELSRYAHAPVTQTPSPPGSSPAVMTGALRASVTCTMGASSGVVATSVVGPHTIYAATQEFGGVHHGRPDMWLWIRYIGPQAVRQRGWVKQVVDIPARPYVRPSRDAVIASGAVTAAANAAFVAQVWS